MTNSGSTVHRYAYGYDPSGNRTSQQIDLTVNSASYNSLNQLQTTTGGGPMRFSGTVNQNSTVTLNGNPATQSSPTQFTGAVSTTTGTNVVTVVAKDTSGLATTNRFQVVTAPGTAQTLNYDLNGNETQDKGHTYEWDAANRLTAIVYSSNGNRTEFSYDGLGRRVKIVEKAYNNITSTKQFVYVGSTMAEERDATGTNVTRRFYPQGEQIGSTNYYYTRDHLGSVRELLSSTGTVVSRLGYDPYGNATLVSGTIFPDFGYAGMYTHQPSKLNLTLYRAYDPNTARWLSRDPLKNTEMKQGPNLYEYVGNNPVDRIDPLGLCVVHYWSEPDDGGWGHLSLTLDDGTYISNWPANPVKFSIQTEDTRDPNFNSDKTGEENRNPTDIRIEGLDEQKIKDWWRHQLPKNNFNGVGNNCSKTIANALREGGLKLPSEYIYSPASTFENIQNAAKSVDVGSTWTY